MLPGGGEVELGVMFVGRELVTCESLVVLCLFDIKSVRCLYCETNTHLNLCLAASPLARR
jgi:hypothetical protein